jgi:hypothetical protein
MCDGLVNTSAECGCSIDDLSPCDGCNFGECQPAIKRMEGDEEMYFPIYEPFKDFCPKNATSLTLLYSYIDEQSDSGYLDYDEQKAIINKYEALE